MERRQIMAICRSSREACAGLLQVGLLSSRGNVSGERKEWLCYVEKELFSEI